MQTEKDIIKDLNDFMNSEVYLNQKKLLDEKQKSVKYGENVVHVDYYDGIINSEDLKKYEGILSNSSLELSSFDKNGVMYASL